MSNNNNHNEHDINKILKETYTKESFGGSTGLQAIREDPTRHISRTDKEGIYYMFTEILDNSIDESIEVLNRLKGLNPNKELEPLEISIKINQKEGTCQVEDHGRGITIEPHEKYDNLPTVCAVFETDNMGSKGTKSGVTKKGYSQKTMGVHGAGGSVVTACSEFMTIRTRVYNEEKQCVDIYEADYYKGFPVEDESRVANRLQYVGEDRSITNNNRANTGLTVTFKPDLDVMSLYNPTTREVEEEYFLSHLIKKRISDTLYTISQPLIIRLDIDGKVEEYDSRRLSYSYNKELDKDYFVKAMEPEGELKESMKVERISDFFIELMMMPLEDYTKKNEYIGFVNRIKVTSSPHIEQLQYLINAEIRRYCHNDPELQGYFRSDSIRGIRIIPMLYVEQAQWSSQVKTDYSDYRVADTVATLISKSGELKSEGGYFHDLVRYCFECSKPYLLAERNKEQELIKAMDERKRREMQVKQSKQKREKLNEDLRYLNLELGEFIFTSEVIYSDLVLVEGRSAGGSLNPILDKMPNIALFTGMWGKIDNANKVDRSNSGKRTLEQIAKSGEQISTLDKLDALFSSPFRRFVIFGDNDADGNHIKSLDRFYIWKFHRKLIEEGRVFEVTPNYCDYTAPPGLKYTFNGEEKELSTHGSLRTSEEYEVVRRNFPGQVKFTLFKGVGSVDANDIYRILNNPDNWLQVPPLTPEEEYQLTQMFTDSSQFKKAFTEVNYMDESTIRKERVKSAIYRDTTIDAEELYNFSNISSYPVYTSVSRKSLEEYEEKGSSEIEMEYLKRQLQNIRDSIGSVY